MQIFSVAGSFTDESSDDDGGGGGADSERRCNAPKYSSSFKSRARAGFFGENRKPAAAGGGHLHLSAQQSVEEGGGSRPSHRPDETGGCSGGSGARGGGRRQVGVRGGTPMWQVAVGGALRNSWHGSTHTHELLRPASFRNKMGYVEEEEGFTNSPAYSPVEHTEVGGLEVGGLAWGGGDTNVVGRHTADTPASAVSAPQKQAYAFGGRYSIYLLC